MTDIERLLPCPFCGASPLLESVEPHKHIFLPDFPDHPGSHFIECGCGVGMIRDGENARAEVIAAWNRRAVDADYERLRGMEERVKGAVPTTWLDPLLSGPNAVLPESGIYNGLDIERLLTAINKRLVPVTGGEGK